MLSIPEATTTLREQKVLRDPVSITCGHGFCRQCITRYWEKPAPSGDYDCPQCRKRSRTRPVLQQLSQPNKTRGSENSKTTCTLDDSLQRAIVNHKDSLKRRYECVIEGMEKAGNQTPLNRIYTELYITEGESEGVNNEHEVWQLETASRTPTSHDTAIHCNDIFKPLPGQEKHQNCAGEGHRWQSEKQSLLSLKNQKYHGRDEMDQQELMESDKEILLKLGKLAFEKSGEG
ncbi:uncharacterized protein LOC123486340 [Coregonus clupeaformis]|uniref:uncharacterized protein LOC123486340 n=1 Tax=Coregonus clupeaformis TaxID=59861 RepID=UPI001E1C802F|nr:uncharacterized protein LOC123486340 [Coregonus clupeaformis]